MSLDIQNVMRIKAAHIEPDGNVVILGGRNAQGKTSVLDAISVAIGGMKLCPDVPIREGQDEAEVSLTLGELQVTRKFKRRETGEISSSLTVRNAEGQPLSPPQRTLDALIGRLAFDPLEFARMAPAAARETLRELVGLDVEQLEDELGRIYRERTEAWRAKRDAQAVVEGMPVPPEIPRKEPTASLTEEIGAAAKRQADYEELKAVAARLADNLEARRGRGEELARQLETLHSMIEANTSAVAEIEAKLVQAQASVDAFELPNVEEIKERLDKAILLNSHADDIAREHQRYAEKVAEAEAAAERWKALDAKHGAIETEIKRRTEEVEYPIEELELRREGVFYKGVPFEQASRAERIKVSLAMGVAMNRELGILLIRDGSVLDDDSLKMIAELAEEHDFQFWIEMARGYEGAAGAVVIEDGGVV